MPYLEKIYLTACLIIPCLLVFVYLAVNYCPKNTYFKITNGTKNKMLHKKKWQKKKKDQSFWRSALTYQYRYASDSLLRVLNGASGPYSFLLQNYTTDRQAREECWIYADGQLDNHVQQTDKSLQLHHDLVCQGYQKDLFPSNFWK